ncbi:AAA family ATPase [uncultured Clostridium sp.]|uniref:AAA family ATPase n=1 Tax=uncultured Clostridium sp. TaxID=59620 RepID=UPI002618F750|nr:AAA family ATPase [uncultured Clostridium sp.]
MNEVKEKVLQYIEAGFPIIYIESFEEEKINGILGQVFNRREVVEWNGYRGAIDFKSNKKLLMEERQSLNDMIFELRRIGELDNKIFIIKDIKNFIEDNESISVIKGLANEINNGLESTIIVVTNEVIIPKEIEKYVTIMELEPLTSEDIKEIIGKFIEEQGTNKLQEKLLSEMANAFKGLSELEINSILALAYAENGEITRRDLSLIFEQKKQMIRKDGTLDMIPLKESLDEIGGLENLKIWLERKGKVFKDIDKALEFGVDMPKGVLIAGVPGCGKSLNAKACAKLFEVPLLRMDMGRLMGKYLGESEKNMRRAIKLAEAISPCVLWIDELEKSFAGVGGVGGAAEVTTRLLGTFLTWMQEKESPVFVVATANDILGLPPELLRKGRFDEIFYVGLPKKEERKKIFEIHIKKRRREDFQKIDLDKLVEKTDGYSGSDIEGIVKESIEKVFTDEKNELNTEDIIEVIFETHSLSELMKENLEKMSKEYEKRKFKNASM